MNYQLFSNLQFRPPLKNSSHSIHIDLRDPSGEKFPFVSVGITRLVLMFRKVSNIHFYYKMFASKQVEIPYYRGVGRQKGRGFGALAQVIGRTATLFWRIFVIPAAKRIGADMLEFAAPEMESLLAIEIFSSRLQRLWEDRHWENNSTKGAAGWKEVVNRGESFQQKLLNNPVGREETFLQTFLVDHVKQQFSVPTFFGSVGKSWRESSNCWWWPVVAWKRNLSNYLTGWKLHRVWISNGSQLVRWFEIVFFDIEAQICQRTWLRNKRE